MTESLTAKYWNDKGYYPTADLRFFQIEKRRWYTGGQFLLKQRWISEFGYEDIWITLPKEYMDD